MCGICGFFSPAAVGEAEREAARAMNDRLFHRGPDSEGWFATSNVVMGMRRLSIIDLAGGTQPLFNESGDIAIVCNGEIYNHAQLRRELKAKGHHFRSESDVECIVHAYEEYGEAMFSHLRGMFAFALWDGRAGKLLLARDRMGEKPLYFSRRPDGGIWFSSELRSLREAAGASRLTPEAFNLFLVFQYVPEPISPLKGVEILPAGTLMVLEPGAPVREPRPYWNLAEAHETPAHPVETVKECLSEACRLMGSADVPVGVALSGGIDSSLVAALTAAHFPGQLHAFTIGYPGRPDTDERSFAATLANSLGIAFTEIEIGIDDVVDNFPDLVHALDTPIGDIAAYGYYSVCKAARAAGYPVLLSGLGGDEFFWGYQWVREAVARNEALLGKRGGWTGALRSLFGRGEPTPQFYGVHADLRRGNSWSRSLMPIERAAALDKDYWLQETRLDTTQPLHLAVSELLNRTWLRSNCLALMDRMSMAQSVEARLPLLDVDLVTRVTGMRNAGLADWRKPHKWLLIEALKDTLPAEVLVRRKQGFTPPVLEWMAAIVKRYGRLLADGALVRQGLVAADCSRHLPQFDLPFLFKLTLLECWVRTHVEGLSAADLRQA